MEIEKINIDKKNADLKLDDQKSLELLNSTSTDIKRAVSSSIGVKMDPSEETVSMKYNGQDEDGNPDIEMRPTHRVLDEVKILISENKTKFLIGITFILFSMFNLLEVFNLYRSVSSLDISYTDFDNAIIDVLVAVIPLLIWAKSTNDQFFNFRNRKIFMFQLSYWFINFLLLRLTFVISYSMFVPFVARIPVTSEMTTAKIIGLAYISTTIPVMLVLALVLAIAFRATAFNRDFLKEIAEFRLFKSFDPQAINKNEYIYKTVRDIKSGSYTVISQKDRQMHTAIIGATGTAKTSSVLLPAIQQDLVVRLRNKTALKRAFKKYVKSGMLRIKRPFEDEDFSIKHFEPNPDYKISLLERIIGRTPKKIFESLISKYEIAGQTILAPEDSLTDDAYDLFTAYGEKVNRVDPKMVDGELKPGFKGMNILYISPNMPDWAVDREKVRRATLLADVMQIMFEMGGKSDPYFASVNRIATTTIALLLQLTYPELKGRQPNLIDVQDHLNDFKKMIEPYQHLFPDGKINSKNKKYQWLKDNVTNFFLGAGSETFEQHARGLKVQFSLFLADDYIRTLVAAEEVIDFDEILANNELTVVNIELPEIGPLNSPALGLFFTVNMTNAVLRRPGNEWTRSFHVWRIDEFPIVVTPSMEQAFTLFRKFKVAMEVALQTLDQMEKSPYLKYLKSVILNSTANQIIFGRANISEMETYSTLAGTIDDVIDMEGITETSIFTENPTMSTQHRKTKTRAFVQEQSDIRNKDFQEVTYFYTKRGSLMPPKHGKVDFLSKRKKRGPRKILRFDWEKLYDKYSVDQVKEKPILKDKPLSKTGTDDLGVSKVHLKGGRRIEDAVSEVTVLDHSKEKRTRASTQATESTIEIVDNKKKSSISSNSKVPIKATEMEITLSEQVEPKDQQPIDSRAAKEQHKQQKFDFFD